MAKTEVNATTGIGKTSNQRYHFDIYAIVEGAQELYFGHETQVNVNLVETVKIVVPDPNNPTLQIEIEKCYLSPTKRRGIERRCLIWAPHSDGVLLGDLLGCGIPHTCGKLTCPICRVYGALIPSEMNVVYGGDGKKRERRSPITFIGRITHGGGVAIQQQDPALKQRAMHPSMLNKDPSADPTPTPFKREYNEPGLLYPIYNHCLSLEEREFAAVAYAFLQSLARIGAGNPKGVTIAEGEILRCETEPLLVLDQYLVPKGKRPVISPSETSVERALEQFRRATLWVNGDAREKFKDGFIKKGNFCRWIGDAALQKLNEYAQLFVTQELQKDS